MINFSVINKEKRICLGAISIGLLLLFSVMNNKAKAAYPEDRKEVHIGIYLEAIDNIELNEGTCYFEFWLWADYHQAYFDSLGIKPMQELSVLHCPDIRTDGEVDIMPANDTGFVWAIQKYRLIVNQDYEAKRFPLDNQTLRLKFELPAYDQEKIKLRLDSSHSLIDSTVFNYLKHHGWNLPESSIRFTIYDQEVQSNLGNIMSKRGNSVQGIIEFDFSIDRVGSRIFLKIFLIMYVSFMMATMIFFMDKHAMDARLSLIVGGIFGAIGNKYIIDSEIPHSPVLTLTDLLHNITYVFLFFILVIAIVEFQEFGRISKMDKKKVRRLNAILFVSLIAVYGMANIFSIVYFR